MKSEFIIRSTSQENKVVPDYRAQFKVTLKYIYAVQQAASHMRRLELYTLLPDTSTAIE